MNKPIMFKTKEQLKKFYPDEEPCMVFSGIEGWVYTTKAVAKHYKEQGYPVKFKDIKEG